MQIAISTFGTGSVYAALLFTGPGDDEDDVDEAEERERERNEREDWEMENDPYSADEKEQMGDNDHPWLPN